MKSSRLAIKIAGYKFSRKLNTKAPYPFNLTISITDKCNSMCKTCNIWKKTPKNELNLSEWKIILKSIGDSPLWITISGGEPFLRDNITDIVRIMARYNNPQVITIPTNGILTYKIYKDIKNILSFYKGNLIINISIDGIGRKHDNIRGVKCFDKAMKTYKLLKEIKNKKLIVGIHTVISRYNAKNFKEIYNFVNSIEPDSFVAEIAENRKELGNMSSNIVPKFEDYTKAINILLSDKRYRMGISKITQILRKGYYKKTIEILQSKKQAIPCYAGIASAHIKADGSLVACCMKEEALGNLRKQSFSKAWKSKKASIVRKKIKDRKCYCTLANAYYSNRVCDVI